MLYAYEQKVLKPRRHGNASFSSLILGSVFHTASVFTVTLPKHSGELRSHRFYFIYKLKMSQTPPVNTNENISLPTKSKRVFSPPPSRIPKMCVNYSSKNTHTFEIPSLDLLQKSCQEMGTPF
ncbi:hypothetical protein CDAR_497741 [Caerostris darwini]|uniref:Uncharacterized protein n=1 Tax=Caerostris darwini TaxID=1538125 RepID=A0AAV4PT64_9ARAC|nr:hypothetical protein CDAR_497741 [Caerostris darwini]